MISSGLASNCDLSVKGLENLISGTAPNELASLLRTATSVVQEFIDGKASPGMANVLGGNVTAIQQLRDQIGKNGAIGVLIGICIEKARNE